MRQHLALTLASVLVPFCGCTRAVDVDLSAGVARPFVQATLTESGGCLGRCPAYVVVIDADGEVRFYGHEYAVRKGNAKLSNVDVQRIFGAFAEAGFDSLKSEYFPGDAGCEEYWTDSPSSKLQLRISTGERQVEWYRGCMSDDVKKRLEGLTKTIKDIVNVAQWLEQ